MLHPIQHNNRSQLWCGPAAVAILTGQPTSVIHKLFRDASGRPGITSVYENETVAVMERLGYAVRERWSNPLPLSEFSEVYADELETHPTLVNVPSHYIVIHKGMLVDNAHPTGIPAGDTHYWHQTVSAALIFTKVGEPERVVINQWTNPGIRKIMAQAKRWGIGLQRNHWEGKTVYTLTCPGEIDDVDDIFDHAPECETPAELEYKVNEYIALIKHVRIHGCLC
jgi:hypothetical protein